MGLLLTATLLPMPSQAQRIGQTLGRGVVAVVRSSGVLVSWRKLAQEGDVIYGLYKRTGDSGAWTLVTTTNKTNYSTTLSSLPYGTQLAVSTDGGTTFSEPFQLKKQAWDNVFLDINFETKVLNPSDYKCKFVWPADLDGDGEMDEYIVDRLHNSFGGDNTHKLQAYRADGTCLWTIDIGPNIIIDGGQNDMVVAYDINCDGRAEVLIKSSDGTRFWDKANETWGKYVFGNTTGDTDGDGIIDYRPTSKIAPFYITVVDGLTGEEIESAELNYSEVTDGSDKYSRSNRSAYMNDNDGIEYAFMGGHFGICYEDGIHPSLMMECMDRTTDKAHHNYMFSFGYDWTDGKPTNFHHEFTWSRNDKRPWPAEFHGVRVADVDGDGIDELMNGGAAVNTTKGMVMSAGIGHGDRFRVSDIDPDRPGMEVYAIQQSALLGQLIYDAATGEHIVENYLSAVGDVGRGECMDVDPSHKGYEYYSTMANLYDCKGNVITSGSTDYPYEGIWWNADLQREVLGSPGGSGYGTNVLVNVYGNAKGNRPINFSSESSWAVHSTYGNRPAFIGDIKGDWREEVILMKQTADTSTGIVGYSTNIETNYSIYCLQEDPHYRGDCTTRGYYQSPNTGFYLGGDMPEPPLPPFMQADLRWKGGAWKSGFTTFDMTQSQAYADGKSLIFDISGDNASEIAIEGTPAAKAIYFMSPKGHDYTLKGTVGGTGNLYKSMLGTTTVNGNLTTTGQTVVSEGTLRVNGNIAGPVSLKAKGTLAGAATVSGDIDFEEALNYEGCRLMPEGTMTFKKSLTLPGNVYVEQTLADRLYVEGDLTLTGTNYFTIDYDTKPEPGDYVLAECSGTLTAAEMKVRGMDGIACAIAAVGNQIVLTVKQQRAPATGVRWTGANSTAWDYDTDNFALNGTATTFVAGDEVTFGDEAEQRTVVLDEKVETAGLTFDFDGTYTINGDGAFSGTGSLTKRGDGELKLNLTTSDYTGKTVIEGGTLTVPTIGFAGKESTIGASTATASNLQIGNATLKLTGDGSATDRNIQLTADTATINVNKSSASLSVNGRISGTGVLVKDGGGQLNFGYSGDNTFTGGMVVKKGAVAQGNWQASFGKRGSRLVMEGGSVALIANNSTSTVPVLNHIIEVPEGKSATVYGSYRSNVAGSLVGKGTLNFVSGGVRSNVSINASQFEGTLSCSGNELRLMSGFQDMKKATLQLGTGTWAAHYSSDKTTNPSQKRCLGALTSTATDCTLADGAWEIGYNDQDATYAGKLAAQSVAKVGAGRWILSTAGSSSPITVKGGTLEVKGGSTSTPLTTGLITVNSGATLLGTGYAQSVTLAKGGTLTAGRTETAVGTFHALGDLKANSGSTIHIKLKKSTNDKIYVKGTVKHTNDTIYIEPIGDITLEEGDEITVFTGFSSASGTYVIKCDLIEWDDSTLLTDGKLRVKAITSGIGSIGGDQQEQRIFDLSGRKLNSTGKRGVYIINGKKVAK